MAAGCCREARTMKKLLLLLPLVIIVISCTPYDQDLLEQINRRLDELEYRIAQIEKSTYNNQKNIEKLQQEVSKINNEVSSTKKLLDEQKNLPAVSPDEINEIMARLTSLEMRYNQLSVALNVSDIRELIYKLGDIEAAQKQQQINYEKFVQQTEQLLNQVNAEQIAAKLSGLENSVHSISNQIAEVMELSSRIKSIETTIENLAIENPQIQQNIDLFGLETQINQLKTEIKNTESALKKELEEKLSKLQIKSGEIMPSDLQQYIANTTALTRQLATEIETLRGIVREYDRDRFLRLDQGYVTYVVKSGDTLSSIAQAYGLKLDKIKQLAELNGIEDANRLLVGQRIQIPVEDTNSLFKYPLDSPLNPQDIAGAFSEPTGSGARTGIDIRINTPRKVRSMLPGRVVNILQDNNGYHIRIDHGNGILAVYGNLKAIEVVQGQWISGGNNVGTVENIFHFEIWIDGEPRDPLRILLKYAGKFEATYYSEWEDGKLPEHPTFRITAAGTVPKEWWTIAADPSVIPLGSVVYIPQFCGGPNYGFFKVEDTGAAIKGNKIDIYTSNIKQALVNMRSYVDVYVVPIQMNWR
ncbi:MAG: hypothetical protein PWQ72_1651 [Pseudothermotoga sp.]|jgi:3D (Asp-Asp-Asp) domain-containing protein/septal ring factor EnvC (AmiA/AmiB activator)|nr:hypothetical protein [Pseudothermotoga sp.]MDK2885279.1 hypothetical protein [Pseudothermotoga sp.]